MKIIIAGAGEVGQHLARILADDHHEVTVIDVDSQNLKQLSLHLDILTVQGSALTISVLNEAGVAACDLYIAVTHFPEMNVASAVIAKHLGAPHTIARVRDPELLQGKNMKLFQEMGIDYTVGSVTSCDMFYDPKESWKIWAKYGVLGMEMESAELFTLAAEFNRKALAIMTVSDHIVLGGQTTAEERQLTFTNMIKLALETIIKF